MFLQVVLLSALDGQDLRSVAGSPVCGVRFAVAVLRRVALAGFGRAARLRSACPVYDASQAATCFRRAGDRRSRRRRCRLRGRGR